MKEQLISFETAKLAKEKGFWSPEKYNYIINDTNYTFNKTGDCISLGNLTTSVYDDFWDKDIISAPTQSLLQKWLREKHNIIICVDYFCTDEKDVYCYIWNGNIFGSGNVEDTYEESLEDGLQAALNSI